MKLQDLHEATTLAFGSRSADPQRRKAYDQQRKYDLPLATFKKRASVRKAVQTNLVVKDNYAQTYHIISDIPPLSVKQWGKLIDVSFGEDTDDLEDLVSGHADPANGVRWNIGSFPHFATRKQEGQKTNELWSDKEWDQWEEKREPWTLGGGSAQPTKVKTMKWKQFADDAIKRFPFKAKHDFSE